MTTERHDVAVQATGPESRVPVEDYISQMQQDKPTLLYAALLGTKDEAVKAVKHLLAQINNDHASFSDGSDL